MKLTIGILLGWLAATWYWKCWVEGCHDDEWFGL